MNLTDDEIRVKCAEAMGWKKGTVTAEMSGMYGVSMNTEAWFPFDEDEGELEPPNYPDDPAAALTLCDRLRDRWDIRISCKPGSGWKVVFSYLNCFDQLEEFECEDPSLARAICLPFLRVKGLTQ